MPSASDELRAKWWIEDESGIPDMETKPITYLYYHGWYLRKDWMWEHHDWRSAIADDDAYSAIMYMMHEWDYGGIHDGTK
jgi:hypothetical protein